MNVWGKRSFSIAFPNDATFGTVTVNDRLNVNEIDAIGGGPITINPGPIGLNVNGNIDTASLTGLQTINSNGALALTVGGDMTTSVTGNFPLTASGGITLVSTADATVQSVSGQAIIE